MKALRGFLVVVATLAALMASSPPASAVDRLSPAVWPLSSSGSGPPPVLAGFDPPSSAYGRGHRGVDLGGPDGAEVRAVAAGTVIFVGRVAGVGVVVVGHGALRTTYQPVQAGVAVGTRVAAGRSIGTLLAGGHCGATPCLHLGLLHGRTYLDPLTLFADTPTSLRLLPAGERAAALARGRARAAAARAAARAGPDPVLSALAAGPGRHGFARPVPGPITSPFGMRLHPVLHVWKLHDGTDFGAACGTPIRAPADGMVRAAYANPGYGNRLIIDHGTVDGRHVVTAVNHARGYSVGVGAHVVRGQVVGTVGATGYTTGCHLHLMVWLDGGLVDPMTWFG